MHTVVASHTAYTGLIMADVTYKDIDGFPGYRVGDDGSVWSRRLPIRGGRMGSEWHRLNPVPRRRYLRAGLWQNSKLHWVSVHKLVLEAFVGPCPDGMEGCHFPDPDRTNNAVSNLRWDTPAGNTADSMELDRIVKGSDHKDAKITEADVPVIRGLVAGGMSRRAVAKRYGLSNVCVNAIVNRTSWKHVV